MSFLFNGWTASKTALSARKFTFNGWTDLMLHQWTHNSGGELINKISKLWILDSELRSVAIPVTNIVESTHQP
jgi:hypothetical protein